MFFAVAHTDPEILVPKLPKPQDLQPFPVVLSLRYTGHTKPVRSLATDVSGQWLLSGSGGRAGRLGRGIKRGIKRGISTHAKTRSRNN